MSKKYVGIDPGKTGAIAKIMDDGTERVWFTDAEELDLALLGDVLKSFLEDPGVFVLLEKVQVMPRMRKMKTPSGIVEQPAGQGAVGMLNYGIGYGKYLGMLEALKIPYQEIHPMSWKKEFSLIHQPKERSIQVAIQLFPQTADRLKRKKDHGRAEALLLACYAKRHNM